MAEQPEEVTIRSRLNHTGNEFVVICGDVSRVPSVYPSLSDAIAAAAAHAGTRPARIWYEAVDARGRRTGERLLLRHGDA